MLSPPRTLAGPNVWVELNCKGTRGCARGASASECDDTVAVEGDRCPVALPSDYACSSDRARALVCDAGSFSLWRACRGPDACKVVDARAVQCDTTRADPGDPCAKSGSYACSTDGAAMLACDGSTFAVATSCRGPRGCAVADDRSRVDCDDAVAIEGDPCDRPHRITCSVDGKSELVCDPDRYTKKRGCPRTDCRVAGTELFCD